MTQSKIIKNKEMKMKKLIGIYLLIGVILTPLIYSNNAQGYRAGVSDSYRWGQALGGSFYWPSYLFSIEPEVNSNSLETFEKSIIDIIKYRNDKLFTGQRSNSHALMVLSSIGNCLISEGAISNNQDSIYKEIFNPKRNDKQTEEIRNKVMNMMNGYDFSDIVEEGAKCLDNISK